MFISDVELPTLFIRSINLTEGIVVKSSVDTEQKNNHLFKACSGNKIGSWMDGIQLCGEAICASQEFSKIS